MKRFVLAMCFGSLIAGNAFAEDQKTKDAQAKVDAAKTETCEKGKKFLGDQKAKGKCAAEADEGAKITCSATTFKQMNDLLTKCTSAKPADAKTDKPADKPADSKASPDAIPKCHAVEKADATKVIAEAEDKLSTKCTRLLTDKVREAKCADAANKGKKIEYTAQFDHMMGTGKFAKKLKDVSQSITCAK